MMFQNELYCMDCHLTFDGENEIQYTAPDEPCCPRCGLDNFVQMRYKGKVQIKKTKDVVE